MALRPMTYCTVPASAKNSPASDWTCIKAKLARYPQPKNRTNGKPCSPSLCQGPTLIKFILEDRSALSQFFRLMPCPVRNSCPKGRKSSLFVIRRRNPGRSGRKETVKLSPSRTHRDWEHNTIPGKNEKEKENGAWSCSHGNFPVLDRPQSGRRQGSFPFFFSLHFLKKRKFSFSVSAICTDTQLLRSMGSSFQPWPSFSPTQLELAPAPAPPGSCSVHVSQL